VSTGVSPDAVKAATAEPTAVELDPVTFEVVRHRLWAINNEAAATLKFVSGSPVATEIYDFNTSILDASGQAVVVGPYISSHAICQGLVVETIMSECAENPGIGEGDVFLCSDPYSGAIHQNDVVVASPVFVDGRLIAWTGATIHLVDVGGASKGSQASLGAGSIFEEAPPIPPIKLVERGILRRDLEREFLIRSRTPELNALDLRAMLAANSVAGRRIVEVAGKYGPAVVVTTMERTMAHAATRLRARLRELPDGTWRHTSYLDYGPDIYACRVTMTKQGDGVTFDFSESTPQAPAVINCAWSGLVSGLLISVLTQLCWDIPWSPSGIMRPIELRSKPGTFVHATWPAGVSKATTAASFIVTTAGCVVIAKMLAASESFRDRAMAVWTGAVTTADSFGTDQRGEPYGATILDGMGGGGGARATRDGINTGGLIRTISSSLANVETYEFRYPVLYLYRRQGRDTGGAGKYRGGVSVSVAYTPHDIDVIPGHVPHATGVEEPESVGIYGGYPGSTNAFAVVRDSDVEAAFAAGQIPMEQDDLDGQLEVLPGMVSTHLSRGDVFFQNTSGGGGYGDPLERDPSLVCADVLDGLVSIECAAIIYGVVVSPETSAVDDGATRVARDARRSARGPDGSASTS
jgi:N-methylhydantoinase B